MHSEPHAPQTPTVDGCFHHLHLLSKVPGEAADWYRDAFGGALSHFGPLTLTTWPGASKSEGFRWFPAVDHDVPSSVGGTLDHFGWSVATAAEVDALHRRLIEAGARSDQEPFVVPGSDLRISFVVDPFGTRIELLHDPTIVGWHHVHLLVPDPASDRTWWQRHFGGRAQTFNGLLPGLRFTGPRLGDRQADWWILFRSSETPLAASAGRSIDHLAFWVEAPRDVDRALGRLQEAGVEILDGPRDLGPLRVGFVQGPGGVKVEILSAHAAGSQVAPASP